MVGIASLLPLLWPLLVMANVAAAGLGWHGTVLRRWPHLAAFAGLRGCLTLVAGVGICTVHPASMVGVVALCVLVAGLWMGTVLASSLAEVPGGVWGTALVAQAWAMACWGDPGQAWGAAAVAALWWGVTAGLVPCCVRHGWWRVAYLLGPAIRLGFTDRSHHALRVALRVARAHPMTSAQAWRWLETRLPATPLGWALLGRGLLASERGDAEGARRWMGAVPTLPSPLATSAQRRAAAAWLCADAAREGRWDDVLQQAQSFRPDPIVRSWRLAAECVLATEPVSFESQRAYLEGLCPRQARHLLPRLLALPAPPPSHLPVQPGSLPDVLRFHLEVMRQPVHRTTLDQAGALFLAWDAVAAEVPAEMRAEAESDLLALAREACLPLEALAPEVLASPTAIRVTRRLLQDLHNEVSARARACSERLERGERLSGPDEWMEWMTLRAAYERARCVGGSSLAGLLWPPVHMALNLLACRTGPPWDNPVFTWLSAEARARQDEDAASLEERNTRATQPPTGRRLVLGGARGWVLILWILIGLARVLTEHGSHVAPPPQPSPRLGDVQAMVAPQLQDVSVDRVRPGMGKQDVAQLLGPPLPLASPETAEQAYAGGTRLRFDRQGRASAVTGRSVQQGGRTVVEVGRSYRAVLLALGAGQQSVSSRTEMTWQWNVPGPPPSMLRVLFANDCVTGCVMETVEAPSRSHTSPRRPPGSPVPPLPGPAAHTIPGPRGSAASPPPAGSPWPR